MGKLKDGSNSETKADRVRADHDHKRVEVFPDGSPELARALNDHAALALEAADKATRRRTAAQKRQRTKKVR